MLGEVIRILTATIPKSRALSLNSLRSQPSAARKLHRPQHHLHSLHCRRLLAHQFCVVGTEGSDPLHDMVMNLKELLKEKSATKKEKQNESLSCKKEQGRQKRRHPTHHACRRDQLAKLIGELLRPGMAETASIEVDQTVRR